MGKTATATPRRCVGYIRVSTEGQASEGESLATQRRRVEAWTAAGEHELVAIHADEGVSAGSMRRREGLAAALASLESGAADTLVAVSLSRVTRSVRDLGVLVDRFRARGWSLVSLAESLDTDSAGGRLVVHVLGAVCAWEREAAGERTKEVLAKLREDGVRLGGEALGWRRVEDVDADGRRRWVADLGEQRTVKRIRDLHRRGLSLRQIAAKLAAEGHTTKRGRRWHPATVARVLAARVAA